MLKMIQNTIALIIVATLLVGCTNKGKQHPNIVFILCDDLGYGDVHAMAPQTGEIPTPNMDKLAVEGMKFTNAHSGSSVCTPTRYGFIDRTLLLAFEITKRGCAGNRGTFD